MNDRWVLTLGGRYDNLSGKMRNRQDGSTTRFPDNHFTSRAGLVPSFLLFDAMIGYQIKNWTLALNARNLTNKTYIANCGYGNCYYGDQRTVVGTATYRW